MLRHSSLILCLAVFANGCGARASDSDAANTVSFSTNTVSFSNGAGGPGLDSPSDAGTSGAHSGEILVGTRPEGGNNPVGPTDGSMSSNTNTPSTTMPPTGVATPFGSAPIGIGEMCPSGTEYPYLDNVEAGFNGVLGFAAWGDTVTTLCLQQEPGRICAHGLAGSSGDEYAMWGAGFSITLTPSLSEGRNLNALGIHGVRLGLSQVAGRPLRVMATQADDPRLDDDHNYSDNAFIFGGSSPREFSSSQTPILGLGDFTLPSWTGVVDDIGTPRVGQAINPRKVSTLQVMVVNNPKDGIANYNFCIDDVAFIDAGGEDVQLPTYVAPDAAVELPGQGDLPESPDETTDAGSSLVSDAGEPDAR